MANSLVATTFRFSALLVAYRQFTISCGPAAVQNDTRGKSVLKTDPHAYDGVAVGVEGLHDP
jgi:hypothetical protein